MIDMYSPCNMECVKKLPPNRQPTEVVYARTAPYMKSLASAQKEPLACGRGVYLNARA